MKKLSLVVVAAGLAVAACGTQSNEAAAIENAGENTAVALENQADIYDALADNTSNATAEDLLSNAASNLNERADNVRDAAENRADAVDSHAS